MQCDLSTFSSCDFDKGAGRFKQSVWFLVNAAFVRASWLPFMGVKVALLRLFGAKIGRSMVIKNGVNIKFPWRLRVGDNVWLGESAWIDNLDMVTIGDNVCISQGAVLLTGNHDYTVRDFRYRNAPISLESGVWIGAQSVVCSGVVARSHAVLAVGSVATHDMERYLIYQGNPAVVVRRRTLSRIEDESINNYNVL